MHWLASRASLFPDDPYSCQVHVWRGLCRGSETFGRCKPGASGPERRCPCVGCPESACALGIALWGQQRCQFSKPGGCPYLGLSLSLSHQTRRAFALSGWLSLSLSKPSCVSQNGHLSLRLALSKRPCVSQASLLLMGPERASDNLRGRASLRERGPA